MLPRGAHFHGAPVAAPRCGRQAAAGKLSGMWQLCSRLRLSQERNLCKRAGRMHLPCLDLPRPDPRSILL